MTSLQRRVIGAFLLAVVAVSVFTFGYAVIGEGVAAFCIPQESP